MSSSNGACKIIAPRRRPKQPMNNHMLMWLLKNRKRDYCHNSQKLQKYNVFMHAYNIRQKADPDHVWEILTLDISSSSPAHRTRVLNSLSPAVYSGRDSVRCRFSTGLIVISPIFTFFFFIFLSFLHEKIIEVVLLLYYCL